MPLRNILEEKFKAGPTGFGGVQPTSPTDFGSTVASPTGMPAPMAPGDPRRDPNDPWANKGAGPGFTPPAPPPTAASEPESEPQTFFEKFPTPQEAWKDWLGRMGQFLARQPGETPNFPGLWGTGPIQAGPTPQERQIEDLRENRDLYKGYQKDVYPTPFQDAPDRGSPFGGVRVF